MAEKPNWAQDAVLLESPTPKSEKHPGRRAAAAKRDDSFYDFGEFEDQAGWAGSSESEFNTTLYDFRRAGAAVDSLVDRNGRYDRARGVWINRDRTEVTTKQLRDRFEIGRKQS
jgi:hypothetical protein